MRRYLNAGDTFVDVGANFGYFTALAADLVNRGGVVHAIEPVPDYADRLIRLTQLNQGRDIRVYPAAAGDFSGTIDLFVNVGDNLGVNSVVRAAVPDPGPAIRVPVLELASILDAPVHLIKIDVEGFEVQVLRGLSQCLESIGRPPILCEVNPEHYVELGVGIADLALWLDKHDYAARDVLRRREIRIETITGLRDVLLTPR